MIRIRLSFAVILIACVVAGTAPPVRGTETDTPVRIPFAGSITLEAAVSTPAGDGPFPLAIVSHGSGPDTRTMHPATGYLGLLRTWLLEQGYALVVPMRRGYGTSGGGFAEGLRSCERPDFDYTAPSLAAADDIEAALRYMRTRSFVDAARIVRVGHSAGGMASLAEASRNPEGVVAVVNFAGGRAFPPEGQRSGFVCNADRLVEAMAQFGRTTRVPSLWIYSTNDQALGPAFARRMFNAFAARGAVAELVLAPPYGNDGHELVNRSLTFWPSVVGAFLKKVVPR